MIEIAYDRIAWTRSALAPTESNRSQIMVLINSRYLQTPAMHRPTELASARWLSEADLAGAADGAAILRLLASSEKSYTQMMGHVLTTVLQPLHQEDVEPRVWLPSDDAAYLVDVFETDCTLHREMLIYLAREASRPDPVDPGDALMRWVSMLATSCTAVAASQAKCERLLAKTDTDGASEAYVLHRYKSPGTLTDAIGLPLRRLDEYRVAATRIDELGTRATRQTALVSCIEFAPPPPLPCRSSCVAIIELLMDDYKSDFSLVKHHYTYRFRHFYSFPLLLSCCRRPKHVTDRTSFDTCNRML